jgi:hypothetical protein
MGDVSVAAWTARKDSDRLAQYVATSIGEIQSHFSIIWFDPELPSTLPTAELHNVRLSNDLVISRTGWDEQSSVVALRSGGPANHEHADRNSVIFAAYGERLFHDPYHAAYSYTDALWFLRFTSAHTAVLLNGKGHQYHDGHEGTNASWAEAEIVSYIPTAHAVVVTSDATQAYRLVTPETALVRRTLVFLKPDVLLLLDHVRFTEKPGSIQVRFQVDNSDGKGSVTVDGEAFVIHRPGATARAIADDRGPVKMTSAVHPVGKEHGVYPYAELASGEGLEHRILTVCTAQQSGREHGILTPAREGDIWTVKGMHNGRAVNVRIDSSTDLPTVSL